MIDNDTVIGYVMFGQISDSENEKEMTEHLRSVINQYHLTNQINDHSIYQVTEKSQEQILAVAQILEACTFYVLLKDMVSQNRNREAVPKTH